jgi:hypothetical protein
VKNGKRRTAILILALLMAGAMPLLAQSERSTDFGAIVTGKFDANLTNKWAIEVEEELRFDHNCTQLDRWLNSVTVEYPFLHNRMHVGLTGGAIRRYNDRGYYENRFRVGVDVNYAETFRRFKFSFRSRVMATFRDENVADYRVNPKLYWRNRLQASYQAPNSRFKYSLSVELHWLLNDPKASVVDNVRTVLSVDYRLSRRQHLEFSARMDNDIQVKKPVDRFYFGITYHYKF